MTFRESWIPRVGRRRDLDRPVPERHLCDLRKRQWLAGQLHHPHLIRDGFRTQQEQFGRCQRTRRKMEKGQADKATWPFG